MTSRILTYFSTGLVLLFIHSSVHFHVILLNMKHYIFNVVNILIYLTYLSLLFISPRFLFVTYLHLFLGSLVSLHLSEDATQFSKMLPGFPARGHFQRNILHLVFFCVIIFHVSNDSFSLSDYSFLNEKRVSFRFNHRQGVWILLGSIDWTFG